MPRCGCSASTPISASTSCSAEITLLSPDHGAHRSILQYIEQTQVHGYVVKVKDVFEVCIPGEREAYTNNKHGVSNRVLLFHGTRNGNVRHILRSGLICPSTPPNGRMLGTVFTWRTRPLRALTIACRAWRMCQRCCSWPKRPLARATWHRRRQMYFAPPDGYDLIHGKAGHTRLAQYTPNMTLMNDEFVVFSPAQQTIRYLVTFER